MVNSGKESLCYVMILFCALFYSNTLFANEENKDAPLNITGTTKVNAEEIFELVDKTPDLIIIDARIRSDRIQGYIESSVSLPDIQTSCSSLKKIIPSKSSPLLFYCNGVKCGRSGNSAKKALKCGYKTIYWFRGGFEEWKSKNLPFIRK